MKTSDILRRSTDAIDIYIYFMRKINFHFKFMTHIFTAQHT